MVHRLRPLPVGSRLITAKYTHLRAAWSLGKCPQALTALQMWASSDGLLLRVDGGVGGGGAGGRLEYARQMDVKVLDFDLATALPEFAGKDFCEAACTFPD